MKIGIDIDNTLTDTLPVLKDACGRYNKEVVQRDLIMNETGFATYNLFDWTEEEEFDFCHKYIASVLSKVPIKSGAIEVLKQLEENGDEIHIITARTDTHLDNAYAFTKQFLDKNNIAYNKLIVGCTDKLAYCKEVGISLMVDDEPQNIKSISKEIPVIVFEGPHNKNVGGKNIVKVNSWNRVYEVIEAIKKYELTRKEEQYLLLE